MLSVYLVLEPRILELYEELLLMNNICETSTFDRLCRIWEAERGLVSAYSCHPQESILVFDQDRMRVQTGATCDAAWREVVVVGLVALHARYEEEGKHDEMSRSGGG